MFYHNLCLIYEKIGSVLSNAVLGIRLLFKNLDFLATLLAHFNACPTTLFVIITFFQPISSVGFLQLKELVYMLHNNENILRTTYFKLVLLNDLSQIQVLIGFLKSYQLMVFQANLQCDHKFHQFQQTYQNDFHQD